MANFSSRRRKRKHIDYDRTDATHTHHVGIQEQEEKEEEATTKLEQSLAQSEAEDLEDLAFIASYATKIDFDGRTGRPIRRSRRSSLRDRDSHRNPDSPIDGLVKLSKKLLHENDPDLFRDLTRIHAVVKQKVRINDMVPWAGTGGDSTRLRAFGFLGKEALTRLDKDSAVRLHAPEKQGKEALLDERANRRAICVLHKAREYVRESVEGNTTKSNESGSDNVPKTVNPTLVADKICAAILANQRVDNNNRLDSNVLCSKELVAYQTNLHNGAKHLAAHLDAPLHEGFGKVIVTVAIRGSATILLIGKGEDEEDDEEDDEDSDRLLQPAWKFHLKEGEVYMLSGNARNMCLHAVLADNDDSGGNRESLNLRFGIHSVDEAEMCIKRHWPDLW